MENGARNLNAAVSDQLEEVRAQLETRLTNGRCSPALEEELAKAYVERTAHVFNFYEAITCLERGARPRMTKPAGRLRHGPLDGLYHQHVFQPRDISFNFLSDMFSTPRLGRFFERHEGAYLDDVLGELSHELVIKSYEQRAKAGKLTSGTWLIFERINGANAYLALAKHSPSRRSEAYNAWAKELSFRLDRSRALLKGTKA